MAGFGRSQFGRGPFGRSDVGGDLIVRQFPIEYLEDSSPEGVDPLKDDSNLLLQMLKTYANSVSKRREEVDSLQDLMDYQKTSSDILLLLGDMLGIGIDKNDPDFLKRSFVGNASQWLQIKSTDKGYQVRGLASGFVVDVDNFWRIDPAYVDLIPAFHVYYLKPLNADPNAEAIPHADVPPGTYAGTPSTEDATYAKSAYVRVVFQIKEPRKAGVDYNMLLDLVIDKIKDVVAIHHELTAPQFLVILPVDNTNITTNWIIHENIQQYDFNQYDTYDIVAGDEVPCDFTRVEFLEGPETIADYIVEVITNCFNTNNEFSQITNYINPTVEYKMGQEIAMSATMFPVFDQDAGDNFTPDTNGSVTISVS